MVYESVGERRVIHIWGTLDHPYLGHSWSSLFGALWIIIIWGTLQGHHFRYDVFSNCST